MPGRTLPTFTAAEVESHNSAQSCFVALGSKVYNVTDFVDSHPGGGELILEYAGKDVAKILRDELSHAHTEAAYEILDESFVGFLEDVDTTTALPTGADVALNGNARPRHGSASASANGDSPKPNGSANGATVHPRTGMSCEEDLTRDTDITSDFKTHHFLDLERPLLMQVWRGGFSKVFYLDQVHRPRHYRGGKSAPLFGNFLEPFSLTPWWAIPIVWLPLVGYGLRRASEGLESPASELSYFLFGLAFWSLIEYGVHRFLFHLDRFLPDNRVGITAHFLMHGVHHYLPMDRYRLVMPPVLFLALSTPFYPLAHIIIFWSWHGAVAAFCGSIFGYVCYDLTHYALHHNNLPLWYPTLKKYHLQHHFLDYELGFGITSWFWDKVFGTELPMVRSLKMQ